MTQSLSNKTPFALREIVPCQNILGEGVQWNERDQAVWWTDIHAQKLYRYHPSTRQLTHWGTPERISCFAFAHHDSRLLVAFASGIAWWDLATGNVEWIARPEMEILGNRLNDGRVDRQGRFWVGGLVEQSHSQGQSAALYSLDYSLDHQLHLKRHLTGLSISNALCWSLDSRWLYHTDSPTRQICQYAFDAESGALGDSRIFAEIPSGAEPDGACVDADGCVWNAQWGGARIVRYAQDGSVATVLELPVSQPNLDWLFITSARKGLNDEQLLQQPEAGNLLIYQTQTRGLPECRFGRPV
jgi:L-arabinonolactonase